MVWFVSGKSADAVFIYQFYLGFEKTLYQDRQCGEENRKGLFGGQIFLHLTAHFGEFFQ